MKSKACLSVLNENAPLTKYILSSEHKKNKYYGLVGAVFISIAVFPARAEIVTVPPAGRTGTNGAAGTYNVSQGTTGGRGALLCR